MIFKSDLMDNTRLSFVGEKWKFSTSVEQYYFHTLTTDFIH